MEDRINVNPQRRSRTCLGCGRTFVSEGPGHRRCGRCDKRLDGVRLPETFGGDPQGRRVNRRSEDY